jgi:hypothetical protein
MQSNPDCPSPWSNSASIAYSVASLYAVVRRVTSSLPELVTIYAREGSGRQYVSIHGSGDG